MIVPTLLILIVGIGPLDFSKAQQNLLLVQCTRFGDSLETPAAWTACVQDSDCVLGRNICGFPMGLNAGHVADQDQLNQCVGPRIACPMIYLDPNNYRAACQAGQCQAVSKDGSGLSPLGSSRAQPE